MKTILIALVVLMWILSLVLSWINCKQRERLAELADDLEEKMAALEIIDRLRKGVTDEHE